MTVLSMATSNVLAASILTVISMCSVICHVLKRQEPRRGFLGGRLPSAAWQNSDLAKFEEANDVPYLQVCISKSPRFRPAGGMILPLVDPHAWDIAHNFIGDSSNKNVS